jgi:hypothetical protein
MSENFAKANDSPPCAYEDTEMMKGEFVYVGDDGELHDEAMHEAIMTPATNKAAAARSVQNAIERGMTREAAETLYGYVPEAMQG